MQYDFDTELQRRGTNSVKWDLAGPEELPMWVADMDFPAAPEIAEAIRRRAEHPVWGYTTLPDAWYEAVLGWWKTRHGFEMEREWLLFANGAVPAISSVVRRLTQPGEGVLIQSPVYNHFFISIEDNGRRAVESLLQYENGTYRVDFADLEAKLADPQTTLMILCNPHNPTGMIWDRETLARVGALCEKHQVLVLSDEIHCDLTVPGRSYVPFASVSEACARNSITCVAPSKAFNLAGLQTSAVVIPDPALRNRVRQGLANDGIGAPSVFAVEGAVAAFTRGGPWLDALRDYLEENRQRAAHWLEEELPQLRAVPAQATYLLWLDCGAVTHDSGDLSRFLRREAGLWLSSGAEYRGNGGTFLRMNLACPRSRLEEGLRRLKQGITAYQAARSGR